MRRPGLLIQIFFMLFAAVVYLMVFTPNRDRARTLHRESRQLKDRVHQLQARIKRLKLTRDELASGQKEAIGAAVREVLKRDQPGTYLPTPRDVVARHNRQHRD